MIEQIDTQLIDWIKKIPGFKTINVQLNPPESNGAEQGVGLYFIEARSMPTARTVELPPLRFQARYLVTVQAPEPEERHHLFEELAFAALADKPDETRLDPLPADLWAALGVPPQPALILEIPVWRERPQPELKLVREPLVLHAAPIIDLHGIVVGPGKMPLSGAWVEMPEIQRTEQTDSHGYFCFRTIPAGQGETRLTIRAKGRKMQAVIKQPTSIEEPAIISVGL
jgi:hypothetical protein